MPQKPQYIEACDGLHWIYRKLDLIKSYFYDMNCLTSSCKGWRLLSTVLPPAQLSGSEAVC